MSRGILNGKNPQLFYFKGTSGMREAITLTLNNGVVMPMAGIGAFLLSPDEAEASCAGALAGGCRLTRQTCLFGACFVTSNSLEDKQYGLKYGRIGARELGKSKEKACTYRGRSGCIRTTVSFGWKISSFHMGNWTQKTIG